MSDLFFYGTIVGFSLMIGVMVGVLVSDRITKKFEPIAFKLRALSPESQRLVNGYIDSRIVNDDRKYSKFKKV